MGLFENIVSNAKQAANVVGKKTGELVDTSKLKLQAVDLNNEIKRNYEALGRAVYEASKQGIDSTEEIDDIIIIINEKYDELDEVNEQLSKMSNKTFCTRCGEPNPKTAGFCSQCGEKLIHEVPQDDAYAAQGGCSCGCHAETEPQQQEQAQQEQPAQEQTEKQNENPQA